MRKQSNLKRFKMLETLQKIENMSLSYNIEIKLIYPTTFELI